MANSNSGTLGASEIRRRADGGGEGGGAGRDGRDAGRRHAATPLGRRARPHQSSARSPRPRQSRNRKKGPPSTPARTLTGGSLPSGTKASRVRVSHSDRKIPPPRALAGTSRRWSG